MKTIRSISISVVFLLVLLFLIGCNASETKNNSEVASNGEEIQQSDQVSNNDGFTYPISEMTVEQIVEATDALLEKLPHKNEKIEEFANSLPQKTYIDGRWEDATTEIPFTSSRYWNWLDRERIERLSNAGGAVIGKLGVYGITEGLTGGVIKDEYCTYVDLYVGLYFLDFDMAETVYNLFFDARASEIVEDIRGGSPWEAVIHLDGYGYKDALLLIRHEYRDENDEWSYWYELEVHSYYSDLLD